MTGFTPGPLAVWPSLYDGYSASVVVDGSDPLRTLAQVREYADATLYASAPAMFDALTEVLAACYQRDFADTPQERLIAADRYTEALLSARAALAKAGGE